MIKRLINRISNHNQDSKETNSYRNENGFMSFVRDYIAYADFRSE